MYIEIFVDERCCGRKRIWLTLFNIIARYRKNINHRRKLNRKFFFYGIVTESKMNERNCKMIFITFLSTYSRFSFYFSVFSHFCNRLFFKCIKFCDLFSHMLNSYLTSSSFSRYSKMKFKNHQRLSSAVHRWNV